MILITDTHGGLHLSRDDDPDAAPLFVANDELAALLADLLVRTTDFAEVEEWDVFAYLCGNDQAAELV